MNQPKNNTSSNLFLDEILKSIISNTAKAASPPTGKPEPDKVTENKPFYMVYVEGRNGPKYKHESIQEARKEAERLCAKEKAPAHLLAAVGTCIPKKPVFADFVRFAEGRNDAELYDFLKEVHFLLDAACDFVEDFKSDYIQDIEAKNEWLSAARSLGIRPDFCQ